MKVGADEAASTDQQQQQQPQQQQKQVPVTSSASITSLSCGDYDEQILKLMHTLGIEPCKTIEVNDDVVSALLFTVSCVSKYVSIKLIPRLREEANMRHT